MSSIRRARSTAADGEGRTEADLLSYLLFDSRFTRELIELGWQDAERRHGEIVSFFAAILEGREPETTPRVSERKATP